MVPLLARLQRITRCPHRGNISQHATQPCGLTIAVDEDAHEAPQPDDRAITMHGAELQHVITARACARARLRQHPLVIIGMYERAPYVAGSPLADAIAEHLLGLRAHIRATERRGIGLP